MRSITGLLVSLLLFLNVQVAFSQVNLTTCADKYGRPFCNSVKYSEETYSGRSCGASCAVDVGNRFCDLGDAECAAFGIISDIFGMSSNQISTIGDVKFESLFKRIDASTKRATINSDLSDLHFYTVGVREFTQSLEFQEFGSPASLSTVKQIEIRELNRGLRGGQERHAALNPEYVPNSTLESYANGTADLEEMNSAIRAYQNFDKRMEMEGEYLNANGTLKMSVDTPIEFSDYSFESRDGTVIGEKVREAANTLQWASLKETQLTGAADRSTALAMLLAAVDDNSLVDSVEASVVSSVLTKTIYDGSLVAAGAADAVVDYGNEYLEFVKEFPELAKKVALLYASYRSDPINTVLAVYEIISELASQSDKILKEINEGLKRKYNEFINGDLRVKSRMVSRATLEAIDPVKYLGKGIKFGARVAKEVSQKIVDSPAMKKLATSVQDVIAAGQKTGLDPPDVLDVANDISGLGSNGLSLSSNLDNVAEVLGAVRDLERHTPLNPGTLRNELVHGTNVIADTTFRSATYVSYFNEQAVTLYRIHSKGADGHLSSFWSRTKPSSRQQAMIDSAISPSWGSDMTVITKIEVPPGHRLHEGVTAPIKPSHGNIYEIVGGGNQVYLDFDVPKGWVKSVENLN